jgi:hypothetical protein
MNNTILQLKVKQRLNKLASSDYDNIECWKITEAFNKAQLDWCRRNLHGINALQEGDEQSTRRIDDFQVILTSSPLTLLKKDGYYESSTIPDDYFQWKRVSMKGKNDCCEERPFVVYQVEEANLDLILRDENMKPSFDWAETVATIKSNKIQIYTNNEFEISSAKLVYYRFPVQIEIVDCENPYTGVVSTIEIPCEFKDDVTEVLIDEAVKILAGDIEAFNQRQIAEGRVEQNN